MKETTHFALEGLRAQLAAVPDEAFESVYQSIDMWMSFEPLRSYDVAEVLFGDAVRRGAQSWCDRFLKTAEELMVLDQTAGANLRDVRAVSRWISLGIELHPLDLGGPSEPADADEDAFIAELNAVLPPEESPRQSPVESRAPSATAVAPRALGVLRQAGYRVGRRGIHDVSERRSRLAWILESDLPREWEFMLGAEYLASWGPARTWRRVERLVTTLHGLLRLAIARDANHLAGAQDVAISHYTEDLNWLREKLEPRRPPFPWPSTPRKEEREIA